MSVIDKKKSRSQFDCYDITSLSQLNSITKKVSDCLKPGMVFYLHGDLGAGKTTFTQYLYKNAGGDDTLNSPTFSIMETYELDDFNFIHLDLYRLENDSDLDALALRDYIDLHPIWIIEWPQRVASGLPLADVNLYLSYDAKHNTRQLCIDKKVSENIGLSALC